LNNVLASLNLPILLFNIVNV